MSGARPTLRLGFVTHVGLERERNEDAFVVYAPYEGESAVGAFDALFVVADGMGGHQWGDVASRFVAHAVAAALLRETAPDDDIDPATCIEDAVRAADAGLRELVRSEGLNSAAGSTLTLAALRGSTLHLGHIGDSRAYCWRERALTQLTHDHSWVADQVRAGLLSLEEAAAHPKRNLLTYCLGVGSELRVFCAAHQIAAGDRYLICTDGLHGVVPADMLARVLAQEVEPQNAAARLVSIANEAGGPDNITCIVFDIYAALADTAPLPFAPPGDAASARDADTIADALNEPAPTRHARRRRRVLPHVLVTAGIALVLSAGALGAWRYHSEQPDEMPTAATAADSTATTRDSLPAALPAPDSTVRAPTAVPDSARDPPRARAER